MKFIIQLFFAIALLIFAISLHAQDTLKVIMICSDTGRYTYTERIPIISGSIIENGLADFSKSKIVGIDSSNVITTDYQLKVWWEFGYAVIWQHPTWQIAIYPPPALPETVYLNEDKKLFRKGIIVIHAKIIK